MRKADADNPVMTLSDDVVTLRPWSRDDAGFMAEACADPAIRRYNGVLDRLGRPTPPLSIMDAESLIGNAVWEGLRTARWSRMASGRVD